MRRLASVLLIGVLVVAGCARTGEKLGAGGEVGLCAGWWILDSFDEPDVADLDATLRWADGAGRVLDRIDVDEPVDEEPVPEGIVEYLEITAAEVEAFVAALRDGDALDDAWIALTAGPYAEATRDITTFVEERC